MKILQNSLSKIKSRTGLERHDDHFQFWMTIPFETEFENVF